jgi:hypothetical protein
MRVRSTRHIAILFHEADSERTQTRYVVHHMADIWREEGLKVSFLFGTARYVPADLLFMHVDLSVIPPDYVAFAERYPVVINGRVRDIRKSVVSTNLVAPGDAYVGPVIVKSDLNFGGNPEYQRNVLSSGLRPISPSRYHVVGSLAEVPPAIFSNPNLVVEKFLPEIHDGLYHVNLYRFLGSRGNCTKVAGRDPVVKSTRAVSSREIDVHPAVEAMRAQAGFDYGKFDYVVHDGQPIIVDMNKTVGVAGLANTPEVLASRRERAAAIYEFLQ